MAEHIPTMQASYKALVKGITSLDFGNKTPCILYLTTEKAFPLLVDSAGETLIAASRFGQGKVVILPNKEYLTMPSFLPFLQNAVTWLKPPSVPEVGVQSSFASLAKFLTSKAHKVQTSDTFNKSYGVYCTHADDKSQELVAFIKNGGGLLIAGQPDPTAATNDADVFEAYSGNKITGVTGIQFSKLQSKAGVYPFTENIPLYILKVNETIIAPHMNSLRKDAYNSEVKSTANSSPLFVYGSHSFPLFQTKDGGNFVAGAMYGRGRVLVISHKDLLTFPEFKSFPEKALDWLDGGRKGKVGFTDNMSHLRDININLSKVEKPIKIPNLDPSLSVICCDAYTEQDTDKILEFVAEGGGLLVNGHAWTWIVNNTKKNPLTDLPANKILWNMGIIIPGGSVKVSDYEPMNSKDFSSYYNFLSILKLLERFTKKEDTKIFNSTHVSWYPIISLDFNSLLKMSQENNLQIRCIFDLINKIFSNLDVPNLPININNKNACLLHLQTLYYNQYATEEESKPEWMKITPIPPNSPVENVLIDGNNKGKCDWV
ncbi:TRPM8 channel-associated factor homolog [Bombina bombina]|uniref:TRPM8 channel-associated factor homolog n=1 Tax=Bombina bombina TaxID=8345 RepID=UPI00235B099E|nr:TRPM8 channel-associated factor homolog [Bombina bombina]